MVTTVADEQLMSRFQSGDTHAFEVLVRRHRTAVFNFIVRFSGQRHKAEDWLQEIWLRVIRNRHSYLIQARFTTWLYTIARNLCVDNLLKENLRKVEDLEKINNKDEVMQNSYVDSIAASNVAPDRNAHNAFLRTIFENCLAKLPLEQREVFLLREYHGLPFQEIAIATNTPLNTVKSRMRYALERLQKLLMDAGIDGDMAEEPKTGFVA